MKDRFERPGPHRRRTGRWVSRECLRGGATWTILVTHQVKLIRITSDSQMLPRGGTDRTRNTVVIQERVRTLKGKVTDTCRGCGQVLV